MKETNTGVSRRDRGEHIAEVCRLTSDVLQRVGNKWTVLIIMNLAGGPKRFSELSRMTLGISQRMLTLTLRGLEQDGLVTRTMTPAVPPRVDYELTALGNSLRKPVIALGEWALAHQKQIQAARKAYEAGGGGASNAAS